VSSFPSLQLASRCPPR